MTTTLRNAVIVGLGGIAEMSTVRWKQTLCLASWPELR
jgi:hypothetical protein